MKKIRKMFYLCIGIIAIYFIFGCFEGSKAMELGEKKYLQRAEKGFYSIQKWNGSEWIYVTYSIINYSDEYENNQIAYCVNPDLKGIGYISGEVDGYNVELKELLSNQKVWRAITSGYPYKTPEQMGVEDEQDAYLATKMALYAMLRDQTSADIRNLYRAGEDRVSGESIDDIQRRGNKVINAICNLVDIGNNGSQTMESDNLISIEKVGEFKQDSNKNYYSQTMKINSPVECREYKIKQFSNFPYGTKITNDNGTEQDTFKGGDVFKVMIPKSSLIEDIRGTIEVKGECKNFPIYYAECVIGDYQNYVLCCDSYSKNIDYVGTIDLKVSKSKLSITKIDKDKKTPIQDVEFSIKYLDGEEIGTFCTNEKGIINLDNLRQGKILVKEIKNNENYILDRKEKVVDLKYDDVQSITIENEIKKGTINIIKLDADDNETKIEGAKFELYSEKNEFISSTITDKNGEAKFENLPINVKYYIKEVETPEEYILDNQTYTVELKHNEIKTVTFKNKKKKVEKLPRTGEINFSNLLLGLSIVGIVIKKKIV